MTNPRGSRTSRASWVRSPDMDGFGNSIVPIWFLMQSVMPTVLGIFMFALILVRISSSWMPAQTFGGDHLDAPGRHVPTGAGQLDYGSILEIMRFDGLENGYGADAQLVANFLQRRRAEIDNIKLLHIFINRSVLCSVMSSSLMITFFYK